MLAPPFSSPTSSSPVVISKLTKTFADSLNAQQLSNFLTWILYYDMVEPPELPEAWYKPIHPTEMAGWVALGTFLARSQEAGCGYGFHLVVLDAICDRVRLSRSTVHSLLIQFSSASRMRYSTLSTAAQTAQQTGASHLQVLQIIQAHLNDLYKLAIRLNPQQNTQYEEWHPLVLERIKGFLNLVINPRIAHLKNGKPLLRSATAEQLPKDVTDDFKLAYLFEVMQQERIVPISRYGEPSSSRSSCPSEEIERARNHAISVMSENRDLRAQIAGLAYDKKKLVEANEELTRKVASLQTSDYTHPLTPDASPTPSLSSGRSLNEEQALHVPQPLTRRRSISSSPFRLPTPTLGRLALPSPFSADHNSAYRRSYAMGNPGNNRRSGIIFTAEAGQLVAQYGDLNGDDGMADTPTPVGRMSEKW
jgi:hypothetical protein